MNDSTEPQNGGGLFLSYPGKRAAAEVIANTAPARLNLVRSFAEGRQKPQNRLYWGDNLGILKTLSLDEAVRGKVRLVYIDPPYSTNQTFHDKKSRKAYHDDLTGAAYIEAIRQRLILLRELMSDDGSIYVHLDSNMAFAVKLVMDEVFGVKNFRNWITRRKCSAKNYTRKQFGNIQDFVLFYSKGSDPIWNRPYEEKGLFYEFEERFPKVEKGSGRRYALVPVHARGTRNGATGKPWRGKLPPEGKHWQYTPAFLDELDAKGEIYWSPTGNPRRKIYADQNPGVPVQDIWLDFKDAHNQNIEITGYPTEKCPELIERIIAASSNEGDLVMDCYVGSGTTLGVAQRMGRSWIGVDQSDVAISVTVERLLGIAKKRKLTLEQLSFLEAPGDAPAPSFALFKATEQPASKNGSRAQKGRKLVALPA